MAPMVLKTSFKGLFLMTSCTLITLKVTFFFITSIPSTSKLMIHEHDDHQFDMKPPVDRSAKIYNPHMISTHRQYEQPTTSTHVGGVLQPGDGSIGGGSSPEVTGTRQWQKGGGKLPNMIKTSEAVVHEGGQPSGGSSMSSIKGFLNDNEVYHDKDIFMENYKQMNRSLKIYIYQHQKTDPYANVLFPSTRSLPGGNYASESYFKIALSRSHFITQNASEADLFFLPFSIASMRADKRIGIDGIKNFVKDYISTIRRKYPFWNRTGGADHFYVACHSIGRTAMDKASEVKINAIQIVCSSSYFLQGYNAHKDASIPQIWPRPGAPPTRHPSKREMLAFYAGGMNSRVRESLVRTWINDTEIDVHQSRLKTPYSDSLLRSKFCLHVKGFEVNTARVGDAIYYGCVPVVLADHYDLPFTDILNWSRFSVVVSTEDIRFLKKILKEIVDSDEYVMLQKNVIKVQNHFQWHKKPVDFDTFYMVMYEVWLRRSSIRIHLFNE
ncbi:hypothetical protein LXL04_012932 [Taraxacum kok-saghyz]